jgi:hypothetical protein
MYHFIKIQINQLFVSTNSKIFRINDINELSKFARFLSFFLAVII